MPFIDDITCTIYDMSSTVYDITFTLCVTAHNACISDITHYVYDISTLYGITHIVVTTQTLCKFTATMSDIISTLSVSSHPLDQFYQTQCMYDITATMCMTSHPQFRTSYAFIWHQVHSIWPHFHCISVIKPTLSMISEPLYVWAHIQYICDITSSIFMT